MPTAFREVIDTEFPKQLGFLAKFTWKKTDLLPNEFKQLCTTLINNKECYAQHKYDIGNPDLEYHITLKKRCTTRKTETITSSNLIRRTITNITEKYGNCRNNSRSRIKRFNQ